MGVLRIPEAVRETPKEVRSFKETNLIKEDKIRVEDADIEVAFMADAAQISHHLLLHVSIADVDRLYHEARRDDLRAIIVKLHVQGEGVGLE